MLLARGLALISAKRALLLVRKIELAIFNLVSVVKRFIDTVVVLHFFSLESHPCEHQ